MVLVYFEGGHRHGQVETYDEDELARIKLLVFDGVDGWVGVYERSARGQTRVTTSGPAEVWSSMS